MLKPIIKFNISDIQDLYEHVLANNKTLLLQTNHTGEAKIIDDIQNGLEITTKANPITQQTNEISLEQIDKSFEQLDYLIGNFDEEPLRANLRKQLRNAFNNATSASIPKLPLNNQAHN